VINISQNQKKDYASPLNDELGLPTQHIGEGVIIHDDKKNQRMLVDIDYGTRRKVSSTAKSMLLSTATFKPTSTIKLSINCMDSEFKSKKELEMADEKIAEIEKRAEQKARLDALKPK
jgi:hypothetical protein